jgi:chromate transporter
MSHATGQPMTVPALAPEGPPTEQRGRVREVAWVFLRLGATAFGGPAAHVAMMEQEVVRRRGWVTREEFLDLYSATNFIPGPNSTEMAIHLGHRRAGWWGLIAGGVCFIAPAVVIVTACAWGYVRYGQFPQVGSVFRWIAPVIVAVVAQALWGLGKSALRGRGKGPLLWAVTACAIAAAALGVNELIVLTGAGLVMAADAARRGGSPGGSVRGLALFGGLGLGGGGAAGVAAAAGAPTPGAIFWVFAKIGSVLFGSGYVLLAFLESELVRQRGWLTQQQMIDAVAVGQFTPGPVFTTATFIGYVLAGYRGAAAATAGIFLPAFVFVAITAPLMPRLRRSRVLAGALDGVNAASLALMAVVLAQLARHSVNAWPLGLEAAAALAVLLRWRINSAWLVLGAALLGVAASMAGYAA